VQLVGKEPLPISTGSFQAVKQVIPNMSSLQRFAFICMVHSIVGSCDFGNSNFRVLVDTKQRRERKAIFGFHHSPDLHCPISTVPEKGS
jgi:hypothetical protein